MPVIAALDKKFIDPEVFASRCMSVKVPADGVARIKISGVDTRPRSFINVLRDGEPVISAAPTTLWAGAGFAADPFTPPGQDVTYQLAHGKDVIDSITVPIPKPKRNHVWLTPLDSRIRQLEVQLVAPIPEWGLQARQSLEAAPGASEYAGGFDAHTWRPTEWTFLLRDMRQRDTFVEAVTSGAFLIRAPKELGFATGWVLAGDLLAKPVGGAWQITVTLTQVSTPSPQVKKLYYGQVAYRDIGAIGSYQSVVKEKHGRKLTYADYLEKDWLDA